VPFGAIWATAVLSFDSNLPRSEREKGRSEFQQGVFLLRVFCVLTPSGAEETARRNQCGKN